MTTTAEITLGILLGIIIAPIVYVMFSGDFPGAQIFYGLQEDSTFVNAVFTVREFFTR